MSHENGTVAPAGVVLVEVRWRVREREIESVVSRNGRHVRLNQKQTLLLLRLHRALPGLWCPYHDLMIDIELVDEDEADELDERVQKIAALSDEVRRLECELQDARAEIVRQKNKNRRRRGLPLLDEPEQDEPAFWSDFRPDPDFPTTHTAKKWMTLLREALKSIGLGDLIKSRQKCGNLLNRSYELRIDRQDHPGVRRILDRTDDPGLHDAIEQ